MVREVAVEASVPDTTVEEFHSIVLDTKATILEYHKQEGDAQASVTPWQDDVRVITFAVPLTGVPEVIKTAIGTSVLTIQETQRRSWASDGTLTVTSEPVLDFVGGSKFTTSAEFIVRPEGDGCKVYATVVCTAAGPWGLISTIENLMANQAEESVRDFLHFCARKCMMYGGGMEEPSLAAGYASDLDSIYDNYQDASEALPDLAAAVAAPGNTPGVDAKQVQLLLQQLSSQSRGMEATLSSLRAAIVQLSLPTAKDSLRAPSGSSRSSAVYVWTPLVLAFALGACLGVASSRTSAALWRR